MKKTMFDFDSTDFIESTMLNCFASSNTSPNRISEQSWTISKKEWDRLINYIRQKLHSYSIEQGLQKAQSARIEINQLIRPLLETLRNNFRNFILSKTDYSDCYVILVHVIHNNILELNINLYANIWLINLDKNSFLEKIFFI